MTPYDSRQGSHRRPLAALPLEPFLPRASKSLNPAKPRPRTRSPAGVPLQLQDMSLLPSPFLGTAAATHERTRPAKPLATLYEAPAGTSSRDASTTPRASPRARMMMQEDDSQSPNGRDDAMRDEEDEREALALDSSPRRLFDAFVAAGSDSATSARRRPSTSSLSAAHFVTERAQMPPPPSPRRTGSPRVARASHVKEDSPPRWTFYQDDEETLPADPTTTTQADSAPTGDSGGDDELDMPPDKENAAPPREARRARSNSRLSGAASSPAQATVPIPASRNNPSVPGSPTQPRTPPRPASPTLPSFSPPVLSDAHSSFTDTGATAFFSATSVMSTSFAALSAVSSSAIIAGVPAEVTSSALQIDAAPHPEAGLPRKKRRSDEAGRAWPLP